MMNSGKWPLVLGFLLALTLSPAIWAEDRESLPPLPEYDRIVEVIYENQHSLVIDGQRYRVGTRVRMDGVEIEGRRALELLHEGVGIKFGETRPGSGIIEWIHTPG